MDSLLENDQVAGNVKLCVSSSEKDLVNRLREGVTLVVTRLVEVNVRVGVSMIGVIVAVVESEMESDSVGTSVRDRVVENWQITPSALAVSRTSFH